MKRWFLFIILSISSLCCVAQNKHELRATWLTTVSNIDWPADSLKHAKEQKMELINILDSIVAMNFNAVFFHIRPACDAFYRSNYEPWSSFLNNGRGTEPGYDPLEFCLNECHKRGMQCFGWINPYRYSKTKNDWKKPNDIAQNYSHTNPHWLLKYKETITLDPGNPQVLQQIKNIVGDIINHYDIDGIVLDDYFYPYSGTTTQDAHTVRMFKPEEMDIHDWRRDNVNKMIKAIYDTIRTISPWINFGVSPFGIWTNDEQTALKEGLQLPEGIEGANMYNKIYCDPITWLKEQTIDFLSPQLYWSIGSKQNFGTLSEWWGETCEKFNVHFYPSLATYRYNSFSSDEIPDQIRISRASVKDNTAGIVFYNTKSWMKNNDLRESIQPLFTTPAILPTIARRNAPTQTAVEGIYEEDDILYWIYNMRENNVYFTIYALPLSTLYEAKSENKINTLFQDAQYLIGISYDTHFELPRYFANNKENYAFAIGVVDKYNNEYSIRLKGSKLVKEKITKLLMPFDGERCNETPEFAWKTTVPAIAYQLQIARDEQFQHIVFDTYTNETFFDANTDEYLSNVLSSGTFFWRVRSTVLNSNDIWSKTAAFSILP